MNTATQVNGVVETTVQENSPPPLAKKRGGGPKTPEGKSRSRRSALKDGFRAQVVLPDDLAAIVTERTARFTAELVPTNLDEEMLVRVMALTSAQYERAASMAVADLQRVVDRAQFCWEQDRTKDVENLAARLGQDPSRVARALRTSRQGADWLIHRWQGLGEDLRSQGRWDDDQRRLAHDLLGAPLELRKGNFFVPEANDAAGLSALVSREIARLRDDQEAVLDELDRADRAMAMSGMALYEDATTARLRRHESRFYRAYSKARADLFRRRETGASTNASARPAKPIPPMPTIPISGLSYHVNRIPEEIVFASVPEREPARTDTDTETETKTKTEKETKTETEKETKTEAKVASLAAESKLVSMAKATVAPRAPIVNAPPFKNRKARRAEEKRQREQAKREAAARGR
jgi:hypothetical protein